MIRVRYFHSFDKSLQALILQDRKKVVEAIQYLLEYFSSGQKSLGLGLRKLRGNFWEIRASLNKRVLFILEKDRVSFVIVGSHDEISRYLRKI